MTIVQIIASLCLVRLTMAVLTEFKHQGKEKVPDSIEDQLDIAIHATQTLRKCS
jgi:hypothetical protein